MMSFNHLDLFQTRLEWDQRGGDEEEGGRPNITRDGRVLMSRDAIGRDVLLTSAKTNMDGDLFDLSSWAKNNKTNSRAGLFIFFF